MSWSLLGRASKKLLGAVVALVFVCFLIFPSQTAGLIEVAKRAMFDRLASLISKQSGPASSSLTDALPLWESAWDGNVISGSSFRPTHYDYQYDELQQFFIDRAQQDEAMRETQLNFDDLSGSSLISLRDTIHSKLSAVSGIMPHQSTIRDLSITLVGKQDNYSLFRVRFKDAAGLSIEGLLAKPVACTPKCPVLIAPNGYSSAPDAIMGISPEDYQHQFGKVFAESRYIVFAVHIPSAPYDFEKTAAAERNAWLLANLSATRYWSYWWIDKVMGAVDYIETLNEADSARIAIYGISMGGDAALYSTVLDPRIDALIVSGTNVLTPRMEMVLEKRRFVYPQLYIWDTVDIPSADELLFSVFPRPVCVELGQYDTTGDFQMALESAQRVQSVYQRENRAGDFQIVVHDKHTTPDGHETEIQHCKAFLDHSFSVQAQPAQ